MHWFLTPVPRKAAERRLYCIPYAGGGAAVYREWASELSESLELCAAQLPGRGWRLRETPSSDLPRIADELAEAIAGHADRPFGIFGHSMGAWLALLVTRRLEEWGREPLALVVSGRQAPSLGSTQPPLAHLEDADFIEEIQVRYGGIPEEILANREVLELLLPALRADVAGLERYVHRAGQIRCPLVVVGGDEDPIVPVNHLEPWAAETTGPVQIETFPGGHFYFRESLDPLLRLIELRMDLGAGIASEGVKGP